MSDAERRPDDRADRAAARLEALAAAAFGADAETSAAGSSAAGSSDDAGWSVSRLESGAAAALRLPDRAFVVAPRDAPGGATHWTLALERDGATVSKFGPLETLDAVAERTRELIDVDVRYTVCCDG